MKIATGISSLSTIALISTITSFAACRSQVQMASSPAEASDAEATLLGGSPALPCTTPDQMPADYPPFDGTPFYATGEFHHASGPNLETTGFRVDYQADGQSRSAEIDMLSVLKLDPQKLYACNLLLDSDDHKPHHVIVVDGHYASACGNFLKRRKIVVAAHVVDLGPGTPTGVDAACAGLAIQAVGGQAN